MAYAQQAVSVSSHQAFSNGCAVGVIKTTAKVIPFKKPESDEEYFQKLEIRYGAAYAQWLIEEIRKHGT